MRSPLLPLFVVTLLLGSGCATLSEEVRLNLETLEMRVAELESANRHLTVRNDALNDKLALVEDQLHSLVLSQRQRSRLDQLEVVALAPEHSEPYPTTYDDDPFAAYPEPTAEAYEDIVISDDKYEKYFGQGPGSGDTTVGTKKYVPKPNVVSKSERIPVVPLPRKKSSSSTGSANSDSPTVLYEEGLAFYRTGNFKPAIEKFRAFLDAKPPVDYIDNALYWLGECHFGLGQFSEAAAFFHQIVQEHPNANKVPDALLKVGLTYVKLKKPDSAREVLFYLIEAFPETEAARVGRNRLEKIAAAKAPQSP